MRQPKIHHNLLRYPLDDVLGSRAAVRLMRVLLHDVVGPIGIADAARLAGLSTPGVRKALDMLQSLGAVERVGSGRALKYGAKEGNPYSVLLSQLFEREGEEYECLIQAIRDAVAMPEVYHAWLLLEDSRRALELVVVVDSTALSWIGPSLRARLLPTEKQHDLIVEVNIFTRADSPPVPQGAVVLWGVGEIPESQQSEGMQAQEESAERSYRMVQAVAELIRSDPSLVRRALQHTNRLLREGQGTANADISEWRQLLETYSAERLRDLLVSKSPRAERLRRSSPFFAVLTPEERDQVMERMERVSGS
ncbi:MAG: hypothetical protein AB2L09_12735 [Coriobacteriia bacterium]